MPRSDPPRAIPGHIEETSRRDSAPAAVPARAEELLTAVLDRLARHDRLLNEILQRLPEAKPAPEPREQLWQRLGLVEGERRRVTVLFADFVGYTAMAQAMDPEECNVVMRDAMAELAAIVQRYDGYAEKFIGDAICVIFGAPVSYPDEPERAAQTALDMHTALANRALRRPELPKLSLHIGINTGIVVAGTVGDGTQVGVIGDTINTASRLMGAAQEHQTFVSVETARRIRHRFLLEDLGFLKLKGKDRPVPALNVSRPLSRSESAATKTLRAPQVGRDQEMEILFSAAAAVERHGGSTVIVVGDDGLGKTRALEELAATLKERMVVRRASARVHGSPPFEPLVAALRPVLEVMATGPDRDLAEVLLGTREDGFPSELPLALARATVRYGEERPIAVLLDNFQYADRASLDLLRFLSGSTSEGRVLWVVATTPGATADNLTAAGATRVELAPLSPAATRTMLTALVPGALSFPLCARLAERAGGNPEFLAEIALSLVEEGVVAEVGGRWKMVGNPDSVPIPGTVQELIESRIDALPDPARMTIQDAAVIGVRFDRRVLSMVSTVPAALDASLNELVVAGFLGTQPPAPGQPPVYWFRSPLARDVAYHSILRRKRRVQHRKVAETLLQVDPEREEELAEVLAYHFERAEVGNLAAQYLAIALKHAEEVQAFSSAAELAGRALGLRAAGTAAISDDTAARLHERRAEYRALLGDWSAAVSDLEVAGQLREGQGQGAEVARLEATAGWYLVLSQQLKEGSRRNDDAVRLGERHGADGIQHLIEITRQLAAAVGGDLSGPPAVLSDVVAASRSAADYSAEATAQAVWGAVELWRGDPESALQRFACAHALAAEHRLFLVLTLTRFWRVEAEVELGRYGPALEGAETLCAWAEEEGDCAGASRMAWVLARLHRELGQLAQAESHARRSLELAGDHEVARSTRVSALLTLAECQLERGLASAAREALADVPALLDADAWLAWRLEAQRQFVLGRAALLESDGSAAMAAARLMRVRLEGVAAGRERVRVDILEGEARLHQGDGTGRSLLDRALADANTIGSPFLTVQAGTAAARMLPERASAARAAVAGALRTIAGSAPASLDDALSRSLWAQELLETESVTVRRPAGAEFERDSDETHGDLRDQPGDVHHPHPGPGGG